MPGPQNLPDCSDTFEGTIQKGCRDQTEALAMSLPKAGEMNLPGTVAFVPAVTHRNGGALGGVPTSAGLMHCWRG